jgi:hypothetical protein
MSALSGGYSAGASGWAARALHDADIVFVAATIGSAVDSLQVGCGETGFRHFRGAGVVGRSHVGISVGLRDVGRVSADGSEVRGSGGGFAPALVVPVTVSLHNRPAAGTLALTRLSASLAIPGPGNIPIDLGHAQHEWLGGPEGLLLTLPQGTQERTCLLRFPIGLGAVARMTEVAGSTAPREIEMKVAVEASIAWVPRTWNSIPSAGTDEVAPAVEGLGLISELRSVWDSRVGDLVLYVPREKWAEAVLPALGMDRLRLVTVRFPGASPSRNNRIPRKFDAARLALDAGRFAESIRACRDVRRMVQRRLTGSDAGRVVDAIAARRGLSSQGPQMSFLDAAWSALTNLTNSAVHDDNPDADAVDFSAADARACLLLTSVLLELLAESLDPVA